MCERKKREEKEAWVKKEEIRSEMWEIINRERRRRKGVNEEIEMRKWKEYFMNLLVGGGIGRIGDKIDNEVWKYVGEEVKE